MGGFSQPTLIMNPAMQLSLFLRLPVALPWAIEPSEELEYGVIIGVDASRFVSHSGGAEIEASDDVAVHENTVPLPLDGLAANPIRSSYQTACVSLRMLWSLGWVIDPNDVAVSNGSTW